MSKKVKVYFILPTLFAGGAERVISFVSQHINSDIFFIKLIVVGFEKDSKYNIENIPVIYLNKIRVLNSVVPICRILIIDKPDIVISTIGHLNALMGLISHFFPKIKFIGRVAAINKISSMYKSQSRKSIFHRMIKISRYGITRLDSIICQSTDMKNDFLEGYNYDENKVNIIHNPITQLSICNNDVVNDHQVKRFFTVGRLTEIKGHKRILEVLSKIKFPFIYTIVGDGPLKDEIMERANLLGISKQLQYITYTDNVDEIILKNDMFLQGSYSEGFPNALLESCVLGTPVIAFDVPGGTKEIVINGINGYLVKDEVEFLEKLNNNAVWNPIIVRDSVIDRFNKDKIIKQYEKLFLDILKSK